MGSYYDRQTTHLDGSPGWKSEEDQRNERLVAKVLEGYWQCKLHSYGKYAPVDWWAERDGSIVGFLELKCTPQSSTDRDYAILNQRKWLNLLNAQTCGPPSIFVAKFSDAIFWMPVNKVDPSTLKIGGCKRIVKSRNDIEPLFEVPLSRMKMVNWRS